ncbi:PAS domain S-box protein, partial [Methanospirillum hungatei]|uniref:PAS domain-containing protein n=1 Tax=Methanospirillum hungatei TaxID=2203 RepID=UPI002B5C07B1
DHAGAMNVKEVWEDLLHPDDRQKAKETFLAYVNRPVGMYEQYFRMLHIDGHYVWIWSRGRTILDDDGTPTPITVGTHIDITRQKEQEELLQKSHDEIQAAYDVIAKTGEELRASLDRLTIQEQALRESEEKFRTLFESAADGILILEDGKILDCNHQAEVLFRLSKNALIGRSPAELAPPFHPDGVLSHDLCAEKIRTVSAGGPVRFECVHQNSDGREFFAEVTLQQISIQGRAYLQAFIRDISDRKRAEMELIRKNEELATAYEEILSAEAEARESQDELIRKDLILQDTKNRLDDIIAFLPDATFAINHEGMVIAWNRAMEEMTGVMAEDMMGKGNYEYSLPFYNERRPMLIDLALTGDETIADRYPTISRKGSFLYSSEIFLPHFYQGRGGYFWFTSCPFFDHDGNITGAIECIRDITDRKRVEEALEKHLVALTR